MLHNQTSHTHTQTFEQHSLRTDRFWCNTRYITRLYTRTHKHSSSTLCTLTGSRATHIMLHNQALHTHTHTHAHKHSSSTLCTPTGSGATHIMLHNQALHTHTHTRTHKHSSSTLCALTGSGATHIMLHNQALHTHTHARAHTQTFEQYSLRTDRFWCNTHYAT